MKNSCTRLFDSINNSERKLAECQELLRHGKKVYYAKISINDKLKGNLCNVACHYPKPSDQWCSPAAAPVPQPTAATTFQFNSKQIKIQNFIAEQEQLKADKDISVEEEPSTTSADVALYAPIHLKDILNHSLPILKSNRRC